MDTSKIPAIDFPLVELQDEMLLKAQEIAKEFNQTFEPPTIETVEQALSLIGSNRIAACSAGIQIGYSLAQVFVGDLKTEIEQHIAKIKELESDVAELEKTISELSELKDSTPASDDELQIALEKANATIAQMKEDWSNGLRYTDAY